MAKNQSFADVFQKNRFNLKDISKKSQNWFVQQAVLLSKKGITPQTAIRGRADSSARIVPGNLYMFYYDAKHKETLPYFDAFPMVFPFAKTKDGFIGLNMHYLPYGLRVQLLDRLMQFKNNSNMDETTKLKYSWGTIAGVSKFKAAGPCVHMYLNEHVRSPFHKIDAKDWGTAMMLPVESFVGANKLRVWEDSKRKMQ